MDNTGFCQRILSLFSARAVAGRRPQDLQVLVRCTDLEMLEAKVSESTCYQGHTKILKCARACTLRDCSKLGQARAGKTAACANNAGSNFWTSLFVGRAHEPAWTAFDQQACCTLPASRILHMLRDSWMLNDDDHGIEVCPAGQCTLLCCKQPSLPRSLWLLTTGLALISRGVLRLELRACDGVGVLRPRIYASNGSALQWSILHHRKFCKTRIATCYVFS